ncbi:hypothetical protein [Staphylothermus hellenicus]|uniref:Uncharacterized protein n=1 Tax=Staphylothermus hellenicus (strain DSM 12710 / JCM 10830 / BK20S6-10-b1 / P8) TaxID=591019 RepID=D7DB36_STAHD|nr:hypothetical protein [Staphylothermus hellenicus]ADI31383.1 hypothetical protein Shell_0244 [Staphylothermus hellenicus DSM 12710]
MSNENNKGFICKKDGKPMYLIEETEKMSNGKHRAIFYYKCPICGYRIEAEQVIVTVENDEIIVNRRVRLL